MRATLSVRIHRSDAITKTRGHEERTVICGIAARARGRKDPHRVRTYRIHRSRRHGQADGEAPARGGHPLIVHNRSRAAVDELVAAGAVAAASPVDVARQSSVVITMLPDTVDVERVLTGPDGVLSGLQKGAIVIDMSSISPVATEQLAELVARQGRRDARRAGQRRRNRRRSTPRCRSWSAATKRPSIASGRFSKRWVTRNESS